MTHMSRATKTFRD